jgi:prepilin signal peptidase PulO-like enzyme (type II secretory pathway)
VEALTAALFVVSYVFWPYQLSQTAGVVRLVFWLAFVVGFVALFVYDLRWMLLPNRIVYALLGLAAAQVVVVAMLEGDAGVVTGALLGLAMVGGLFYALFQVSGGRWIGGGDVKLGAILGLLVGGPAMALLTLFVASTAGSLVSIPLMATGKVKRTSRVPFGPFLLLAGIVVQLFGASIVAWYERTVLF